MKKHLKNIYFFLLFGIVLIFNACNYSEAKVSETKIEEEVKEKIIKPKPKKKKWKTGEVLDRLNDIPVYFNGMRITNTHGRNKSEEGYNYGLKWQCVEFVKRYYYDYMEHAMPNPWGHAVNFFDPGLKDGSINWERDLYQFKNGGRFKPRENDILVFGGNEYNRFGHVVIVSKVESNYIEIVQQNVGHDSREKYMLKKKNGHWKIKNKGILGWLGKR